MTQPQILVVSGHRSYNDEGNPNEKALTPAMSTAYEQALEAAGYKVTHLQREFDGDTDPDDTVGGLDTVGALAGKWMAQTPGPLVMFDCHYEGANAPGCFAIVPDKKHLGTAIRVWQPDEDQWELNTLDVALARAVSKGISQATGLPLRQGIKEPGVMSETQTGVAIQYSARLAMFAYTAPYRDRAVRLVVEHGSLPVASDRDIIMKPDFTQKCAAAVVAAVNAVYGTSADPVEPTPTPTPDPKPDAKYPDGMDEGIASWLFGRVITSDGIYSFNPKGSVSKAWMKRGTETGAWPELIEVRAFDKRTYFRFADGFTLWQPKSGAGILELK